jgi:hypothetical protein
MGNDFCKKGLDNMNGKNEKIMKETLLLASKKNTAIEILNFL